jgi:hypothetical protein
MKFTITHSFIGILLCSLLIALSSCGGKNVDRPAPALTPEQAARANQAQTPPVVPPGQTVASNVKHYICPNNCAGSGGDVAGTCPVCGTEYLHNQEWHNQAVTQTTQPANPTGAPEPAQNAAGVWHYICSNGCAGGAGSAIACAQCGNMLVHNTAYHN